MSSELERSFLNAGFNIDDIHDPFFQAQANAVPFAYDPNDRLNKRQQFTISSTPQIAIKGTSRVVERGLLSAQSATGSFPKQHHLKREFEPRSTSVPPTSKPGGKRKNANRDDPFIQETFAFPEQQTWLEVRSRKRRAVVRTEDSKDEVQTSDIPQHGEPLSLEKHADHIAALINQKRKENDATDHRKRMSVQQRLHRGDEDEAGKVVAMKHDELKKRMQLSAQGIHEDSSRPESTYVLDIVEDLDEFEKLFDLSDQPTISTLHSVEPNQQFGQDLYDSTGPLQEDETNTANETTQEQIISHSGSLKQATASYFQPDPEAPLLALPYTASQPYVPYFLTQPRFTNQRIHAPFSWPYPSQPWPQAMPHVSSAASTLETLCSTSPEDLFTNGCSPTQDVLTTTRSDCLANPPTAQQASPRSISNINIFTRQARENGVIGGNNNYLARNENENQRKNMFNGK